MFRRFELFLVEYVNRRGCHERRAANESFFVEIEFGMVMPVIEMALLVRRADEEKAAIDFLKQKGGIFGAHG